MKANTVARLLILSMITTFASQSPTAQSRKDSSRSPQNKVLSQRESDELQNALQTLQYLRNNVFEIDNVPDRVRVLLEIADALWLLDKDEAVIRRRLQLQPQSGSSMPPRKEAAGISLLL